MGAWWVLLSLVLAQTAPGPRTAGGAAPWVGNVSPKAAGGPADVGNARGVLQNFSPRRGPARAGHPPYGTASREVCLKRSTSSRVRPPADSSASAPRLTTGLSGITTSGNCPCTAPGADLHNKYSTKIHFMSRAKFICLIRLPRRSLPSPGSPPVAAQSQVERRIMDRLHGGTRSIKGNASA